MSRLLTFAAGLALAAAQLTSSSLENHVDTLTLGSSFNPVKEAYWTGLPHHRRTPFAVAPDGKTAFLAYLDASGTGVHIQGVNPKTFAAMGTPVTIKNGKEAGGLVAHNDGFALLTNEVVSGESKDPLPVIYKYTNGKQAFRTLLGGSGFSGNTLASPDINGDLVFSEKAGYYAAYIVVTSYSGDASGHFGDAIRYITPEGKVEEIQGASSSWGCSHNTGIAFEAADEPPFASLCSEDQGAIWLNTETQGMSNNGVKVSNEHVINGASNEPMGGTSGSYSSLARFIGADSYIFSWVSRGAIDLTLNDWMGEGYTHASNRTNNRNVAIALFSDKKTLVGEQATSKVGAKDGDSQVNWITDGANDCSNAHVATFDSSTALVTWEEISNPVCEFEAMGCKGKFAGTKFQTVDSKGKKLGSAITSDDTYVAGDMVTMSDGRICWPYVNMAWSLDGPTQAADVKKISFACISNGSGSGSGSGSTTKASTAVAQPSSTKTANAGTAKPSSVKSAAAVEISGEPSGIPEGAPRPSFVSVPDSVTDVLSAPNETASSAAAKKPSSVVIKPSVPATAKTGETDAPMDCDDEDSSNVPATTRAPTKTIPSEPKPTDSDEDCNEEESGNAPVATQAPTETDAPLETIPSYAGDEDCNEEASGNSPVTTQAPTKAVKSSGRRTRTRTRTHTRRPGHPFSKKECVAKTVTRTVYVTATAVPGY
ncbi:MUC1 extracellular alpha-1 4-glucan glucosidase [Fusarium beomiforme]|uniref:MUC1 extracellular alpha-1 4-glucan glucosidase n=1 Tax=Fusarium beomiforme TaxID=44412 RepID=A0A9P5E1I7_9HYPO|nr:MUC1 extracellular alpha-1 4-glucan glucosidase [Fusarium beomiforme]